MECCFLPYKTKKNSDSQLALKRVDLRQKEKTRNEAERFRFEQKNGIKEAYARFDYSDNVFSLRGDWKTRRGVMKVFFPWRFSVKECNEIEELINNFIKNKR